MPGPAMVRRRPREQPGVVNPYTTQEVEMNLAARAGRWSAAHWKTATFGWLAFVAAAVALGSLHGTISQTSAEQTNGQAARAEQMLTAAHVKNTASENVLVRSRTLTASAPAFRRDVEQMIRSFRFNKL